MKLLDLVVCHQPQGREQLSEIVRQVVRIL
jgi:hypothetical protein